MGTGVGIDCCACGDQLTYDRDCAEIMACREINKDGERIFTKPPLCARCTLAVNWFIARQKEMWA